MIKIFKRELLQDTYGLPDDPENGAVVLLDEICGKTRWSIVHRIIFRLPDMADGEAWATKYREGATEMQDESPWEYKGEVVCKLVVQREVTETQWVEAVDE